MCDQRCNPTMLTVLTGYRSRNTRKQYELEILPAGTSRVAPQQGPVKSMTMSLFCVGDAFGDVFFTAEADAGAEPEFAWCGGCQCQCYLRRILVSCEVPTYPVGR